MSKKDKHDIDDDFDDMDDNFDIYEDTRKKNSQSEHHKRHIRERLHLLQLAREFDLSPDDLSRI